MARVAEDVGFEAQIKYTGLADFTFAIGTAQENDTTTGVIIVGILTTITAPLPSHMADSWETLGWTEDLAADDPFEQVK